MTIPYSSVRAGSGTLTTEILDPEDHVLGRSERKVDILKGGGAWQQGIAPDKPIAYEEIVWQRVRYRFEYSDGTRPGIEGIESVSEILRRPVVHILGQASTLPGAKLRSASSSQTPTTTTSPRVAACASSSSFPAGNRTDSSTGD